MMLMDACPYLRDNETIWANQHVWRRARGRALARAGYVCERCGIDDAHRSLHVHHKVPVEPAGDYSDSCQHHGDNLVVLCTGEGVGCHELEHANLRAKPGAQLRLVAA